MEIENQIITMLRRILFILLIILVIVQFIQPAHNAGSAWASTDITHAVSMPDTIRHILERSCFDCHSNHTIYPWYSKITPVNWWLNDHINEGKRELNFSIFDNYSYRKKLKKLDETAELVGKRSMPLDSYLWIHKDAKLSEGQVKLIVDWANAAQKEVLNDSLKHRLTGYVK
jgi:hypothetical protein